ncbi:MAG TPA: phosphoenolpyruvate synthase, partial [Candidatus Obscuribacterales bacterium]
RWACQIEDHYSEHYGHYTPMDIEWAQDGIDGEFYIVQARPETVHSNNNHHRVVVSYSLAETGKEIIRGRAIGSRIGAGKARVLRSVRELGTFRDGDVLIADMTDPDWEPIMKRASAIVTNRGGRTCHAAIVSRELGIPCVVGTERATELLQLGQEITVSCAQGDSGIVYDGILQVTRSELHLDELPRTRTRIYLNLGNPEKAFQLSSLPVDGVGLARQEFIIADQVKVHPMAVCRFDEIEDAHTREQIRKLTSAYVEREEYYVDKLCEGIATIAAAFYPRPVILRLSDFKSNEYANLIGGYQFEEREENPMIGLRGASRYYNGRFAEAFALECKAIERVRKIIGLTNLKVMVPFCRTPDEGRRVIAEMRKNGLVQGDHGLEVFVMCELPSNVLAIDRFAEVFDGFSIGSNDLTQLILGLDRDSATVADLFDERNEAVKRALSMAIQGARKAGRPIGICGQAPSDFPDIVKFLVEEGIDSISLNEDAVIDTLKMVAHIEWEVFVSA